MPSLDETISTLNAIRIKIRRLTRSPSTSQLTNDQIDEYINTFILYDFPEFTVDNKFVFYLMPNIDVYETNSINEEDPFYNFKNSYISVQPPVYVAGNQIQFSQSRESFFNIFPKNQTSQSIGTGDSITMAFSGTLTAKPTLPNSVTFSSIDANGNGIVLKDVPEVDAVTGLITQLGMLVEPDSNVSLGSISYLTGVYSLTFPVAPGTDEDVIMQAYCYQANTPTAVLYENNIFTFRPVPDKTYRVEIDAYKRPVELLNANDMPHISQWWQYISYGASKKVFEDRMDSESIQIIMPEFMRQRSLVMQRLVVQQSSERTATIYSSGGKYDGPKCSF